MSCSSALWRRQPWLTVCFQVEETILESLVTTYQGLFVSWLVSNLCQIGYSNFKSFRIFSYWPGSSNSFPQEQLDFVKHGKWGFNVKCAHAGAVISVRRSIWIWFWSHIFFSEQCRPPVSQAIAQAQRSAAAACRSRIHTWLNKVFFSRKEGTTCIEYRAAGLRWLGTKLRACSSDTFRLIRPVILG